MLGKQNIYRLCLTGGPCAGKSTALARIATQFSPEFVVYTLPEIATVSVESGVSFVPSEFTPESRKIVTTALCQMQMDTEKFLNHLAQFENRDVIVISDRGVCDNFAYCSAEIKQKILLENNWDMNFLSHQRYDMILHLVTAAIGAGEFYSLENNVARIETKEQAASLDIKTQFECMSHPNFVIIDNGPGGFEKKIDRVLDAVAHLIKSKSSCKHTKRCWLSAEYPRQQLVDLFKCDYMQEIRTRLFSNDPGIIPRVLQRIYPHTSSSIFIHDNVVQDKPGESGTATIKRCISERDYYEFIKEANQNYPEETVNIIYFVEEVGGRFSTYQIEETVSEGVRRVTMNVSRDSEFELHEAIPDILKSSILHN